jgi:uncharacterized protein YjdB
VGKRRALIAVSLAAIVAAAVLGACGEKSIGPGPLPSATDTIATITLSPVNPSIPVGSTLALTALVANTDGVALTGRPIEWSSSHPEVARVDDAGVVLAIATGTALVTATSEEKTGTAFVTVVQPVAAYVFVSPPSVTVGLGRTVQLTAIVTAADGKELTGRVVIWSSSNPTTSVNESGLVTGLVLDTSTIYAMVDGAVGFATVVVTMNPN